MTDRPRSQVAFLISLVLLASFSVAETARAGAPPPGRSLTAAVRQLDAIETAFRECAPYASGSVIAPGKGRTAPTGVSLLMVAAVSVYQETLSSQDVPVCNYLPSCSHYAQDAFRLRGPALGLLMASDRLERCIGAARSHYPIDHATLKALDPVTLPDRRSGW
jgi:putative component of membrane protein insertase Oxa1/YidC/SpoIIIJ protein YidD